MKTIVVTGGAGFLGSFLSERLIEKGNSVICIDNLHTGSINNIEDLLKLDNFKFIEHDIVNPIYFDQDIDEIYNLACPASPIHYQENPIKTLKTSVLGSINMLGVAKLKGAKILQASTSEVYGDPEITPQHEQYLGSVNTIGIRSCYDEGKRCAESLFFDYHREHGIKIKIARIFNTYGPRMNKQDGRVVSNLIMQSLENKDLTLYGDGSQTRSFCYFTDLLDGLMSLMDSDDRVTGPINLGNPKEITIKELSETILKLIPDSTSKLVFEELPEDDPKQRKPDISRALDELNWIPTVDLDVGLINTINFFKSQTAK